MTADKSFLLMDCTVRDGGYVNNWDFSLPMVQEMYRASCLGGSDVFEVGFLGKTGDVPQWRKCPPELVLAVKQAGTGNTKISAMLEADTVGMPLGSPAETGVDILRVALNRNKIADSLPKIANYRAQGYEVFLQMMGITAYRDIEILKMVELIESSGFVDYLNIGDSYGSLLPPRTAHIIGLIKNNTSLKVGLHPHNNMQLGMANIFAAIDAGADIVDGTMYGMGRGGGNVPLELILSYYGKMYPERFNVLPVLEFIDQNMVRLTQQYHWGYSLPTLLSGVYECHPYYTSKLVDKREYTIEQILKTAQIVSESDVVGFSDKLLTDIIESGFTKDGSHRQDVDDYVTAHANTATYAGRYTGKSVLVLAGGPSLARHQAEIQAFIDANSPIVLGANNLGGLFVPHYHAFNNQRRYEQYIGSVSSESRLLLGPGINNPRPNRPFEEIICYNSSYTQLEIRQDVITANCRSIGVLLGAVALVMGAGKLYFAGMDGYLAEGDSMFYREDESRNQEDILAKHKANQQYLDALLACAKKQGCQEVKSLTPTTYRLEA